jgi:hypothetical protein
MSFVDAYYDRDDDMIRVVERDDKGQRHFKDYSARHIFYYNDPKGKFQSIKGEPVGMNPKDAGNLTGPRAASYTADHENLAIKK